MSEKKRYICDACIQMDKTDTISVLNFLHNAIQDINVFSKNKDGIKLNLDKLDSSIIDSLYGFVKYKINKTAN